MTAVSTFALKRCCVSKHAHLHRASRRGLMYRHNCQLERIFDPRMFLLHHPPLLDTILSATILPLWHREILRLLLKRIVPHVTLMPILPPALLSTVKQGIIVFSTPNHKSHPWNKLQQSSITINKMLINQSKNPGSEYSAPASDKNPPS